MIVTTNYSDIPLAGSPMRTFVAAPKAEGQFPGIWCYSDIFQLTPPMLRACIHLAGYGFVAAAPEIYRRVEPPGTVIPFDDAGRTRGQEDAAKTPVAHFDADCRFGLDWLSKHPKVARGKIGAMGFCIGGHLAFRAALLMVFGSTDPHVPAEGRATVEAGLRQAGVRYQVSLHPAEHAFMRDEG